MFGVKRSKVKATTSQSVLRQNAILPLLRTYATLGFSIVGLCTVVSTATSSFLRDACHLSLLANIKIKHFEQHILTF